MALAASLAWGASQAHAAGGSSRPYEGLVNNPDMKVNFNGYEWFVIADNSTSAAEGSVKLLAANDRFGKSQFNSSNPRNYNYMESNIKRYLDQVVAGTAGEGKPNFSAVERAMLTNEQVGSKLYLLDLGEAEGLCKISRNLVTTQFSLWWAKSNPGDGLGFVADNYSIFGHNTMFLHTGDAGESLGVVPALQLDLSKVVFDSGTRTFYPKVDVTDVTLDKTDMSLHRDGTGKLTATVRPENSAAGVPDRAVTWSSSNASVATVDGNGVVTAIAGGNATITATATNGTSDTRDDKTATCTVTVNPKKENPLTYPATQRVKKPYSASPQTAELALAANAQGDVSYRIVSQTNGSDNVSHFTLDADGKTLTVAASTIPGSYAVVVRATAQGAGEYDGATKDSIVTVEVAKFPSVASIKEDAVVPKGGSVDLANNVTMNGAKGPVSYHHIKEFLFSQLNTFGCTLEGSVLRSTDTNVPNRFAFVEITVPGDVYHDELSKVVAVAIVDPLQTIEAAGVTATYGDTGKAVSAKVTNPATGGGAISYAVKPGSEDYIDVDATSGALTIKKVPADRKAYVTVTAAVCKGYSKTVKDVEVTINPMSLTIDSATAESRAYEPGNTTVAVNGVAFKGATGQPVNLNVNADYTVSGTMTTADAGTGKDVAATVTLNNGNYRFAEGGNTAPAKVDIAKASAPPADIRVVGYITYSSEGEGEAAQAINVAVVEQSVAGVLPAGMGTPLTYRAGVPVAPDGITFRNDFTVDSNGNVSATLVGVKEGDASNNVTLPVIVESQNYNDLIINVIVVPKNKTYVEVAIEEYAREKTYGDAFTMTATATNAETKAALETQDGDWWWYSSDPSVLKVAKEQGSNTMSVSVVGVGTAMILAWYEPNAEGRQEIGAAKTESITVNKRPLTITAKNPDGIYAGGNVPELSSNPVVGADYIVGPDEGGLAEGDSLSGLTLAYSPTPDNAKPGSYAIVPSGASVHRAGADVSANYSISYVNGSLEVKPKVAQTVSASDATATQGDTGKAVGARVTGNAADFLGELKRDSKRDQLASEAGK